MKRWHVQYGFFTTFAKHTTNRFFRWKWAAYAYYWLILINPHVHFCNIKEKKL